MVSRTTSDSDIKHFEIISSIAICYAHESSSLNERGCFRDRQGGEWKGNVSPCTLHVINEEQRAIMASCLDSGPLYVGGGTWLLSSTTALELTGSMGAIPEAFNTRGAAAKPCKLRSDRQKPSITRSNWVT